MMAGVFSLHLPRLSLEALCALGSSFFALTPAPAAGFLQLPLRLGLRRRRLNPRYEAGTVRTGFMKIRNRRNASVCRLSKTKRRAGGGASSGSVTAARLKCRFPSAMGAA